jgi:hypothetical protein
MLVNSQYHIKYQDGLIFLIYEFQC